MNSFSTGIFVLSAGVRRQLLFRCLPILVVGLLLYFLPGGLPAGIWRALFQVAQAFGAQEGPAKVSLVFPLFVLIIESCLLLLAWALYLYLVIREGRRLWGMLQVGGQTSSSPQRITKEIAAPIPGAVPGATPQQIASQLATQIATQAVQSVQSIQQKSFTPAPPQQSPAKSEHEDIEVNPFDTGAPQKAFYKYPSAPAASLDPFDRETIRFKPAPTPPTLPDSDAFHHPFSTMRDNVIPPPPPPYENVPGEPDRVAPTHAKLPSFTSTFKRVRVKQLKQGEQAATSRDAQRSMPQDAMPPASASAHNESEETTVKPYDPYLVPPMPSEAEAMELFFPSAKPKPPGPNDPPERPESGPAGTPSPHDIPAKPATAPKQLQTDSSEPFSPPATPAKEDASSEQEENETAKPYSPFAAMLDLDDFFEQQEQVARDKQKRGRRRKSHQKQAPEAVEQADNAHDTAKQSDQPIAEGNKDFIYGNPFDGTLPDIFQDDEALKRLVKEQGSKKPPADK